MYGIKLMLERSVRALSTFSKIRPNCMVKDFMCLSRRYCTNTLKSHYSVLGLKRGATDEEIKQAYYSLSKKYHPDRNIGNKDAESKILEINAAFEILGNKEEKKKYDSKMFPEVWERNSFIYNHGSEPPMPSYTYRRVFRHMSHPSEQIFRHAKGEYKRKRRHNFQKLTYNKSQSSSTLSKMF